MGSLMKGESEKKNQDLAKLTYDRWSFGAHIDPDPAKLERKTEEGLWICDDEEDHVVQPLRFTKAHTEEDKKEEEGVEYSCLRVYIYSATPENLRRSSITTFSVRIGRLRISILYKCTGSLQSIIH